MSKKILIIGNSPKAYSLAKFLSKNNIIFVAPGSDTMKDFANCIDIREDSISELLEFVLENDIDITIPISEKSLNTELVDILANNNQQVFAPSLATVETILNKSSAKKILYKLRIPTPKFGIFEKAALAYDYIRNIKPPFIIKTNEPSSAVVLTSQKLAKNIIDSLLNDKKQKVIIEDYIWGTPFSFYVLTDGYKALPLGSSIVYRHLLDGDGGQLTSGMGACSPNYKFSLEFENYIMNEVVYPTLGYLEKNNSPYLGILGINGVIANNRLEIIGFQNFMQDVDCSAILENLDIDLLELIESCIIGSFSDEINYIPLKDISATSLVLTCKNKNNVENIIKGLDSVDENIKIEFYPQVSKNKYLELEAEHGAVLIMTATAQTLSSSTKLIYDEASCIDFNGKAFRNDICKAFDL